jgi:hypothetical protein
MQFDRNDVSGAMLDAASATSQPAPDMLRALTVASHIGKNHIRNRLLLAAQMILQQLVPRNIARIHALDRVVHQAWLLGDGHD